MEREIIVTNLQKQPDTLQIANSMTGGNISSKIEDQESFKKMLLKKVVLNWAKKTFVPPEDATYSGYVFMSRKTILCSKRKKTRFFTNYVIPEIMVLMPGNLLYVDVNCRNGKKSRLVSASGIETAKKMFGVTDILDILKKGQTIREIELAIKYMDGLDAIHIQRYFVIKSCNGDFAW